MRLPMKFCIYHNKEIMDLYKHLNSEEHKSNIFKEHIKTIPQGNKFFFQFKKIDNMEDLIIGFYSEEELISAVKYKNAIRDLKALIHNMKIRNEMKY